MRSPSQDGSRRDDSSIPDRTDLQEAYVLGRLPGIPLSGVDPRVTLELQLDVPQAPTHACLVEAADLVSRRTPGLTLTVDPPGSPDGDRAPDRRPATTGPARRPEDTVRLRLALVPGLAAPTLRAAADLVDVDVPGLVTVVMDVATALAGGAPPARPDGPAAARAIAARADGPDGEQAAAQWRQRLADRSVAGPELPLAQSPAAITTPTHRHRLGVLPAPRWSQLVRAAAARNVDPADVPLVVLSEVLRRWSKEPEFWLTVAERPSGYDGQVAQLTVPGLVPVTDGAGTTLLERAHRLGAEAARTRQLRDFSAIRVVRELRQRQSDASAPVVHTCTLRSAPSAGVGAVGTIAALRTTTPQVWLDHQVLCVEGALVTAWHVVDGLFPDGVVEAMTEAYDRLLDDLVDDPTRWESRGPVVARPPDQEAEQAAANDTATDIPARALGDIIATGHERAPDAPAVIDRDGTTTHREFDEAARRFAAAITAAADPRGGQLVAVMLPAGVTQLAAIVGVLRAGGAYVVVDPGLPAARRRSLLERCGVRVVVSTADLVHQVAAAEHALVTPEAARAHDPARDLPVVDVDDLAYVIFTSGSTGEPKGVMISHRSAGNTVQDILARYRIGPADRVLALAPTNFDLSVFDIVGLLGAGGALVVPDPQRANDPDHWVELLREHGVTLWNTVPAPMRLLVDALGRQADPASKLRLVLLSGDWIPTDLPGRIAALLPDTETISLGGATEGSIWSIHHPIRSVDPTWSSIPYGRALANQSMHVLDRWLQPCPTWVTGEIHIGGVGVAAGYWGDPQRTAERFLEHPATGERLYRTGDLGRLLPGGDIEILGREDHQVKINGYRVELGEIEACIAGLPGIEQVVVDAPVHPKTGQRQVLAYVVPTATPPDPVDEPLERRIREAAGDNLPAYMVPARVIEIDAVPLTVNGKVDRSALPAPGVPSDTDAAAAGAPGPAGDRLAGASDLEAAVAGVWATHLGHDDFGLTDGFFDVGGDSLHAVGILRDLQERLGAGDEVEEAVIETLFLNGDVAAVTQVLEAARATVSR